MVEMKFKLENEGKVLILDRDNNTIGHIFTPSGSGNDCKNAIQVCGFSEAFEYWACGIFEHKKDIQLLFNEDLIGGKLSHSFEDCQRCFHKPCQCEDRSIGDIVKLMNTLNPEQKEYFKKLRELGDIDKQIKFLIDCQGKNPFNVRTFKEIRDKLDMKNKDERIDKPSDIFKDEIVGKLY